MTRSPLLLLLAAIAAYSADPWPGETWAASADLTSLNAAGWSSNLSGAYWNPVTRKLWVASNSGNFSRLGEDGAGGFKLDTTFSPGGDLEGITQADPAADKVYVIVERDNLIREYAASTGALSQTWNLDPLVGGMTDPNDGVEGIAFVPNASLAATGFRSGDDILYPQSAHGASGLGGIFLVAVQDVARATAGYVYAVDPRNDGTWTTVGKYKTSRAESADLAFDASTHRLYILHNTGGNVIEVTNLTSAESGSDRKFNTLREIAVPSASNIEGFALTPALKINGAGTSPGDRWAFFTDDDNAQGALRWFKQLPANLSGEALPSALGSPRAAKTAAPSQKGPRLPALGWLLGRTPPASGY